MRVILPSYAKMNLSLRVTGRREDGYHNLVSLFVRIASGEVLRVSVLPDPEGEDRVRVEGMALEGENIVFKALRLARSAGLSVPCLDVELVKSLYPGAGLGAGSGNAAALLRWLAADGGEGRWAEVVRRTGADVPFLFSGCSAALVAGIGDRIEPVVPLPLRGWVVFPDWSVGTKNAYGDLDLRHPDGYPLSEPDARAEAMRLHEALGRGERVGLLPNDFAPPLLERFPDYRRLFDRFERLGCMAWGITGSGGAAFALFEGEGRAPDWPDWVRQVLYLPSFH